MLVSPGKLIGPYSGGGGGGGGPVVLTGELWTSGYGGSGYLGDGTIVSKSSPVQVGALGTWVDIAAGSLYHAGAINDSGELFLWGEAADGRLGDGTTVDKSSPVQVGALTDWAQLSLGDTFSHAIKTDGTLWSWGNASQGRLGNGTGSPDISSPAQVGALTNWEEVSAGTDHVLAVKSDGTLWSWGNNTNGELGQNDLVLYTSPVQVGALTDWAQASAGEDFSAAIKTDGTLWTWGESSQGQLGNGTTTPDLSSPIQVGALTDWASVDCGRTHVLAVKTDGTLWSWGDNLNGPLGHGVDGIDISSPVQVGALTDWSQVSAGENTSGAIKTDGTLWSWGAGTVGGLGLGNTTHYSSPVQVGALTDYIAVNNAASHLMALRDV